MRQKVASFVKSCDTYKKTKPANRNELAGKIPISGLFHTWYIDFAGPLLRTNLGNQYLIVAVGQMSVKPMLASESSGAIPGEEVLANARPFELALALINRAECLARHTLQEEASHQNGDMVLLRRGKQPEGSNFVARMCQDPFKVISVEHSRYLLEKAPVRKSGKPVHFRRLRRHQGRDEQRSDGEDNS